MKYWKKKSIQIYVKTELVVEIYDGILSYIYKYIYIYIYIYMCVCVYIYIHHYISIKVLSRKNRISTFAYNTLCVYMHN